MELPKRRNMRLREYDYSQNGGYFVTICTKERKSILGAVVGEDSILPHMKPSEFGKIVGCAIENIPDIYPNIIVEKYVVMPNHVHILLRIENDDNDNDNDNGRIISSPTISIVIGQMKRFCSKQCGVNLWQRSFHEHIIRNQATYEKIWQYIDENPLKWKLDCYYQ